MTYSWRPSAGLVLRSLGGLALLLAVAGVSGVGAAAAGTTVVADSILKAGIASAHVLVSSTGDTLIVDARVSELGGIARAPNGRRIALPPKPALLFVAHSTRMVGVLALPAASPEYAWTDPALLERRFRELAQAGSTVLDTAQARVSLADRFKHALVELPNRTTAYRLLFFAYRLGEISPSGFSARIRIGETAFIGEVRLAGDGTVRPLPEAPGVDARASGDSSSAPGTRAR